MADLSNWDDVSLFTAEEIAYLLAGVDPSDEVTDSATTKRILHNHRLIERASSSARKHALKFLAEIQEPQGIIAPDIFEYEAWGDELPSIHLRNLVAIGLSDPKQAASFSETRLGHTERYARDDIHAWATSKMLTKGYSFGDEENEAFDEGYAKETHIELANMVLV